MIASAAAEHRRLITWRKIVTGVGSSEQIFPS